MKNIRKLIDIINIKRILVAKNKEHLQRLMEKEITKYGNNCNLNHIDVSKVKDMSDLFYNSKFCGDISGWNTSNVANMSYMFCDSEFNGDISAWNTSSVTDMSWMFKESKFNGDISAWNTSSVTDMSWMFKSSQFNSDITHWNASKVENIKSIFDNCSAPVPYWAKINDFQERVMAIEAYHQKKQLEENINHPQLIKNNFKI